MLTSRIFFIKKAFCRMKIFKICILSSIRMVRDQEVCRTLVQADHLVEALSRTRVHAAKNYQKPSVNPRCTMSVIIFLNPFLSPCGQSPTHRLIFLLAICFWRTDFYSWKDVACSLIVWFYFVALGPSILQVAG